MSLINTARAGPWDSCKMCKSPFNLIKYTMLRNPYYKGFHVHVSSDYFKGQHLKISINTAIGLVPGIHALFQSSYLDAF